MKLAAIMNSSDDETPPRLQQSGSQASKSPTPESDAKSLYSEPPSETSSPEPPQVTAHGWYTPSEGNGSTAGSQSMAVDEDEPSYYPSRKRKPRFSDLSEATIVGVQSATMPTHGTPKHEGRVLVGRWRKDKRYAASAFLDAREWKRYRIEKTGVNGERINGKGSFPSGRHGSCITSDDVELFTELRGLDHSAFKEFLRIRAGAGVETEDKRCENNQAAAQAAQAATEKVPKAALQDNSTTSLLTTEGAAARQASGSSAIKNCKRTLDDVKFGPPTEQTAGADDIKVHDGVKYKRGNGIWPGKLLSPGRIIGIGGQDYVECSVLFDINFA